MRYVLTLEGWELYQSESSDEVPQGFLLPCYLLTAPDGTERTVSADKMRDALDRLFEESA
jgi:hypothetical protein